MANKTHEIRAGSSAEIREESGLLKVTGYAAVFGERANIAGVFREEIMPGAFKSAIDSDDVVFLINHEGLPLARTRSGTLTLIEDEKGLRIESELDASDPDVQKIIPKMKRGDLDKMSFGFIAKGEEWVDKEEGALPLRKITDASLFDVSIVNMPAYDQTEIGLRSLELFRSNAPSNTIGVKSIRSKMKMNLAMRQRIGQAAR